MLEVAGVDHQAEGHHVQREERGDAGAQQQVLALGVGGGGLAGVLGGAIAERRHAFDDALERDVLRAVADLEQVGGEDDFGGGHAADPGESVLDQPAAGGAPHAGEMEDGLASLRVWRHRRLRSGCAPVEIRPRRRLCWKSSVSRKFWPEASTPLSTRMA